MKRRQTNKIIRQATGYDIAIGGRWKLSTVNEAVRIYRRNTAKKDGFEFMKAVHVLVLIDRSRRVGLFARRLLSTGLLESVINSLVKVFNQDGEDETTNAEGDCQSLHN